MGHAGSGGQYSLGAHAGPRNAAEHLDERLRVRLHDVRPRRFPPGLSTLSVQLDACAASRIYLSTGFLRTRPYAIPVAAQPYTVPDSFTISTVGGTHSAISSLTRGSHALPDTGATDGDGWLQRKNWGPLGPAPPRVILTAVHLGIVSTTV